MTSNIVDLFGYPTAGRKRVSWRTVVRSQRCPFLERKCLKVRKSLPAVAIGTCTVRCGNDSQPVIICPFRLLERRQVFTDCLHLLTMHEPGNELHVVPEISIPGGSVDYFLVSVRKGAPVDFVGVELQTLDTTGTVWPARERFLASVGAATDPKAAQSGKSFGMNWKMTAKTTLVQLHHKIRTFEGAAKHLVLALQDALLAYMRREFSFGHIAEPFVGHAMHFHAYALEPSHGGHRLQMTTRCSTDANGVSTALGLQGEANVAIEEILARIRRKLSAKTLWAPK